MHKMVGSVTLMIGIALGSGSAVSGEDLQAHQIPSSQGCPVQMTAKLLSRASMRPLTSENRPLNTLEVVLSGDKVSQIERVKLTVVRSSSRKPNHTGEHGRKGRTAEEV